MPAAHDSSGIRHRVFDLAIYWRQHLRLTMHKNGIAVWHRELACQFRLPAQVHSIQKLSVLEMQLFFGRMLQFPMLVFKYPLPRDNFGRIGQCRHHLCLANPSVWGQLVKRLKTHHFVKKRIGQKFVIPVDCRNRHCVKTSITMPFAFEKRQRAMHASVVCIQANPFEIRKI